MKYSGGSSSSSRSSSRSSSSRSSRRISSSSRSSRSETTPFLEEKTASAIRGVGPLVVVFLSLFVFIYKTYYKLNLRQMVINLYIFYVL